MAATTTNNQQARFAPVEATQIFQTETADCSVCEHCSFGRVNPLYDIHWVRRRNISHLIRCVRHCGVVFGWCRSVRSNPSPFAATMLRSSLDCMPPCLLVGRKLPAGFAIQHGRTCRDRFSFLCRSLCSSQDPKYTLRFLRMKENVPSSASYT